MSLMIRRERRRHRRDGGEGGRGVSYVQWGLSTLPMQIRRRALPYQTGRTIAMCIPIFESVFSVVNPVYEGLMNGKME